MLNKVIGSALKVADGDAGLMQAGIDGGLQSHVTKQIGGILSIGVCPPTMICCWREARHHIALVFGIDVVGLGELHPKAVQQLLGLRLGDTSGLQIGLRKG